MCIRRFTFSTCQIKLIKLNFNIYMLIDIEFGQKCYRLNAEGTVITHTQYANNEFFHNGTAVLLKSVPAESPLSFPGSVFEDNDTDIDNRCGREVNISQTTFR